MHPHGGYTGEARLEMEVVVVAAARGWAVVLGERRWPAGAEQGSHPVLALGSTCSAWTHLVITTFGENATGI